ncbi:MAG: winged helix-turn-helix transcriptional regulator [Thaumarchaeota archaeon]|nr:winged helix-turn-helix transcriptional regulator [Nitrososphaerota archaeon]
MAQDSYLKQLLVYLFAFSRGAEMRFRIVTSLAEKPSNANQLANDLNVDYKGIQHHINVLLKNRLIETPQQGAYGSLYFLSPLMEHHLDYVREIWKRYGKSPNKGSRQDEA